MTQLDILAWAKSAMRKELESAEKERDRLRKMGDKKPLLDSFIGIMKNKYKECNNLFIKEKEKVKGETK